MKLSDPVLHEVFVQWRAWQSLVEHEMLPGTKASDVDPLKVSAALEALSVDQWGRLAHLMIADSHAGATDEAVDLLASLRAYASSGRRPRYAYEAGLTLDEYMDARP